MNVLSGKIFNKFMTFCVEAQKKGDIFKNNIIIIDINLMLLLYIISEENVLMFIKRQVLEKLVRNTKNLLTCSLL